MKRTRNFYVGVTIAAVVAVLAIAQYTLQTVARAQENGSANRAGIYQVDPLWPKPLPNNWVLGATIGLASTRAIMYSSSIAASRDRIQKFFSQMTFPPAGARGGRAGAPARGDAAVAGGSRDRRKDPDFGSLLFRGATGAGIRSGRQPRPPLGRAWRRLRVAAVAARHHNRRQGQRLARRQQRSQHPEVLERWKIPAADRQERRE